MITGLSVPLGDWAAEAAGCATQVAETQEAQERVRVDVLDGGHAVVFNVDATEQALDLILINLPQCVAEAAGLPGWPLALIDTMAPPRDPQQVALASGWVISWVFKPSTVTDDRGNADGAFVLIVADPTVT